MRFVLFAVIFAAAIALVVVNSRDDDSGMRVPVASRSTADGEPVVSAPRRSGAESRNVGDVEGLSAVPPTAGSARDGDPAASIPLTIAVDFRPTGRWKPRWSIALKVVKSATDKQRETTTSDPRRSFNLHPSDFPIEVRVRLDVPGAPVVSVVVAEPPADGLVRVDYVTSGVLVLARVADETGRAIANQPLLGRFAGRSRVLGERSARSDESGDVVFLCEELGPKIGAASLALFELERPKGKDRCGVTTLPETSAAFQDAGTVTLLDGTLFVAGVTRDAAGRPIAGARVDLEFRETFEGAPFGSRSAVRSESTDADGRFSFYGHRAASMELSLAASHRDYRQLVRRGIPVGASDLVLVLTPGARVVGRVVGADPATLRRLAITIQGDPVRSYRTRRIGIFEQDTAELHPDADGRFEFAGLSEGTVSVSARFDATETARVEGVRLVAGESTADPRLNPLSIAVPAQLEFRVMADGRPVADARLSLRPASGRGPWIEVRSDAGGYAKAYAQDAVVDVLCFHPSARLFTRKAQASGATLNLESGVRVTLSLEAAVGDKSELTFDLIPEASPIAGRNAADFTVRVEALKVGESREVFLPFVGGYGLNALWAHDDVMRKLTVSPARLDVSESTGPKTVSIVAR